MILTLTTEIRMKWNDKRLEFLNPLTNEENVISEKTVEKIWLPFDKLKITNAIFGEIQYDKHINVRVHPNIPEDMDPELPIQTRRYNGSFNQLEISRQMKVKYKCQFEVSQFPFDKNVLLLRPLPGKVDTMGPCEGYCAPSFGAKQCAGYSGYETVSVYAALTEKYSV